MYCKFCGEKLQANARFCHKCGRRLTESQIKEKAILLWLEGKSRTQRLANKILERYNRRFNLKKAGIVLAWTGLVLTAALVVNAYIIPSYRTIQMVKGMEHIRQEEYEEAIEAFNSASLFDKDNPNLYKYLGQAYMNVSDYENAGESLAKASSYADQADLEVYKLLAEVYQVEGQFQEYERILQELLASYPNDPYSYIALGEYYSEQGNLEKAQAVLEELLKRMENPQAVKLLYNVYLQSYISNTASEKAKSLAGKAKKYLSEDVSIEPLMADGQEAVSISPDLNRLLTNTTERNKKYLNVYKRSGEGYALESKMQIPALYTIDGAAIAWSPDGKSFAFYNNGAAVGGWDSFIYVYHTEGQELKKLTDIKEDFAGFLGAQEIYLLDTIPTWSEDGRTIYFARQSPGINGIFSVDARTGYIEKVYEPPDGAQVKYNIIERGNALYFSVAAYENSPVCGVYKYENGEGERLDFDYDDKFYFLALADVSADERFLLYYITAASQNSSFFFKVLDMETMKIMDLYKQEIDYYENEITSVNKIDFFGEKHVFICKNAKFSKDGASILLAEEGKGYYGKTIRRIDLYTGNQYFSYLSNDLNAAREFSLHYGAGGSASAVFAEIDESRVLVYDGGLKILHLP